MTDQRSLMRQQRTLKTIESRVLEDVSIGRGWRAGGGALAGGIGVIVTPIERSQPDMRRQFVRQGK